MTLDEIGAVLDASCAAGDRVTEAACWRLIRCVPHRLWVSLTPEEQRGVEARSRELLRMTLTDAMTAVEFARPAPEVTIIFAEGSASPSPPSSSGRVGPLAWVVRSLLGRPKR
jgi:hypothetical protein